MTAAEELGIETLPTEPSTALYGYGITQTFEEYLKSHGSGTNMLRTTRVCQPGALKPGDILATGDEVLSEPRGAYNGGVFIHLTGGWNGHWIDVPARIPIALLADDDDAPEEIRTLATQWRQSVKAYNDRST